MNETNQRLRLTQQNLDLSNAVLRCLVCVFLVAIVFSCAPKERVIDFSKTDLAAAPLIPLPLQISATHSGFPLDRYTALHIDENLEGFNEVGTFLADKIKLKTGLEIRIPATPTTQSIIHIKHSGLMTGSPESYELQISQDSLILTAGTAMGAFRGIQTIRQMIPENANDTLAENAIWVIPTGKIVDAPQFEYRSAMLDVARHFFGVEDIKKLIELLAYYKMNFLHLHLSDDQGWRIEIKSWPKLTEVGGSTEVGGGEGGFYTQEDYSEIVNYAAAHYITIVPEIDMPGHTNAASVSYPFLNGNGKIPQLYTKMRVGFSTLDTRKDTVYAFIDDVIREIAALSPGPYFHIGGDESHVTEKKDYVFFVDKVEKIVRKYGKRMIGWDEVATANIDSTAIVQLWRSVENKDKAVERGMKIILSPANKAYLDMKYDALSTYGLKWAGFIPVDTAYRWDPFSYAPKESILGIEAPLWSETIENMEALEYLAFPRLIGYAELGWTAHVKRDWEHYKVRLARHAAFLDHMNVKYYPSPLIEWENVQDSVQLK